MTLTHGYLAFDVDAVLVVYYPVKDSFSDCAVFIIAAVAVDAVIPVISAVLSTEYYGSGLTACIDQLKEIVRLFLAERAKQPFVDDQQVEFGMRTNRPNIQKAVQRGLELMKNVLIYDIAAEKTGAAAVLREYYERYANNGQVNCYIVTSVLDFPENYHTHIIKLPWTKKSRLHRLYCDNSYVRKLIKKYSIEEVINLQNVALKKLSIPQTVYLHNAIPISDIDFDFRQEKSLWLFKHVISRLVIKNLKYADLIIVQADWIKRELSHRIGIDQSKIIVERFTPSLSGINSRIRTDKTIFFYPAALSSYKNHDCICLACQILKNEGIEDYEVVFTFSPGESKINREICEQIKEYDLPIKLVGLLEPYEMALMYRKSILLFPSYLETVGLPLIEAQYYNAQIIAADLSYSREAIGDYTSVKWFDCKRPDELAMLMQETIKEQAEA